MTPRLPHRTRLKRAPKDVTVRIGGTAAIPAVLEHLGLDPARVLAEVGVDLALFGDADNTISFATRGRLVSHCVARTGCPHFGLLVGQQARLEDLGLLGSLLRFAPDVATALRSLVRFSQVHVRGAAVTMEIYGTSAQLGYASYHAGTEATDQISDGSAAFMFKILRTLCGSGWAPVEVLLARREPEDVEPFRQYFRANLRFNALQYAVVFPARWLDHRLPAADRELHRQLQRQVEALADRHLGDAPEQVRRVLRTASLTGQATLHEVADMFSVHPRTLGRRLSAAGATFRGLLDEERFERTRQLLENTTLAINDIAASLDYSDGSAFIRAFRRWSGTTPGDWRAARAPAKHRAVNHPDD